MTDDSGSIDADGFPLRYRIEGSGTPTSSVRDGRSAWTGA
jgi:hypothetical protein